MESDIDHRRQIESVLRRELTDDELTKAGSVTELTLAQLQVVAELGKRDPLTPLLFLRTVVPLVSPKTFNDFAENIRDYIAAKTPRVERRLDNESLFESTLGRPLSGSERRPISTLDELSPEQRDAAASMYARNIGTAVLYIAAIASQVSAKLSEE